MRYGQTDRQTEEKENDMEEIGMKLKREMIEEHGREGQRDTATERLRDRQSET